MYIHLLSVRIKYRITVLVKHHDIHVTENDGGVILDIVSIWVSVCNDSIQIYRITTLRILEKVVPCKACRSVTDHIASVLSLLRHGDMNLETVIISVNYSHELLEIICRSCEFNLNDFRIVLVVKLCRSIEITGGVLHHILCHLDDITRSYSGEYTVLLVLEEDSRRKHLLIFNYLESHLHFIRSLDEKLHIVCSETLDLKSEIANVRIYRFFYVRSWSWFRARFRFWGHLRTTGDEKSGHKGNDAE